MKRATLVLAVLVLLLFGVGQAPAARADFMVFTDQTAFLGAAPIVSTETFDEFPSNTVLGVGSATVDGVTYTSQDPTAQWSATNLFLTPSPPNSLLSSELAPETLTFGSGNATAAIGFFLIPAGIPGDYQIFVTGSGGYTLTENVTTNGAITYRGFLGVGEDITSVKVSPVGSTLSNVSYDNVSRADIVAATPEPASLTLLSLGSLGLLAYGRRRRKA
jgi:hypothetical protein